MPKGYWIAHGTVDDAQAYKAYQAANGPALAEFGGKFLVRAGTQSVMEGEVRPRCVVIEFASYQDALDCYNSDGYQAAKALRDGIAASDLIVVEGYDG